MDGGGVNGNAVLCSCGWNWIVQSFMKYRGVFLLLVLLRSRAAIFCHAARPRGALLLEAENKHTAVPAEHFEASIT
ncbi:hypothetical protein C6I21_00725 [Alkalicoccus urumqiensis]|uniref:Uncharacterized protein n=1 Tax=Alkalicoccus urumqiensis TaxID=1548213 RepID=A0A2P6MLG8_ALKUR|nr:hypothetical protein C6I21_00725 [Alkalicoccus urumqiensis]